jgi:hypothetical protein
LTAQLVSGYSEESTLYQLLFGLTSRQRRCLGDGGDLSEFVELIDEKDTVLSQIAELETELEPLRQRWVTAAPGPGGKVAQQLNPLFDEIINTIQRTVALERDNERLLEQRRCELHRVLCDARRWRSGTPNPVPADAAMPAARPIRAMPVMA